LPLCPLSHGLPYVRAMLILAGIVADQIRSALRFYSRWNNYRCSLAAIPDRATIILCVDRDASSWALRYPELLAVDTAVAIRHCSRQLDQTLSCVALDGLEDGPPSVPLDWDDLGDRRSLVQQPTVLRIAPVRREVDEVLAVAIAVDQSGQGDEG
jgi:hypothetical protein